MLYILYICVLILLYYICVGSVLSFSVLVQAITFITFGAMADYGSLRKTGLTLCTCIGCFSALLVHYLCITCALLELYSCFTLWFVTQNAHRALHGDLVLFDAALLALLVLYLLAFLLLDSLFRLL